MKNIAHEQNAHKQDIVATLLHRQHLAELHNYLSQLAVDDICHILQTLPLDDAITVWGQVPTERQNSVLWGMSDARREQVAGQQALAFEASHIHAFQLVGGRLQQIAVTSRQDLETIKPIWIDLLNSNKSERNYIGSHFGLSLPDPTDVTDLEISTRFLVDENHDVYLHSNFLLNSDGNSRSIPVSFVVHDGILFTLRNEDLPVFLLQQRRARTQPDYVTDCQDIIIDLYGADVEYSADALEGIYKTLGTVGRQVLNETMSDAEAAAILSDIAEKEDLNGRIRGNILDTQRAIHFLIRAKIWSSAQREDARQILSNIESLNSHTAFLFDKINFLMDATIGFININQNKRINKLTFFSVVFMPINILAGIGGMSEYSMMTQGIPWPIAYAAFLLAATLMGFGTYWILKFFENREIRLLAKSRKVLSASQR